jgi:uncharacterized membrane protein YdfJ with MMPL/SSD domain
MSITTPHSTPAAQTRTPPTLARLVGGAARGASRRPKLTILLWLALVAGCLLAGGLSGTRQLSNAASGTGESAHAAARLHQAGLVDPATEEVLISSSDAAQTAAATAALSSRARGLSDVRSVSPPATKAGGRTALVVVSLRGDPNSADAHVAPLEHTVAEVRASHPAVTVREAGGGSIGHAIGQAVDGGLQHAELISIPITLVILVLAFGALAAAAVPLLLGLTSVAAAIGAGSLVSHLVPMGNSTAPVVVLIGLAVGVDYSLFYVRRERAESRAGAEAQAALQAASATVGRAIVVAGATVVIGLSGLLFTGFGVFTSMALGAILVVAIAVLGSLTVLPAVLALAGDGRTGTHPPRLWRRRRSHAGNSVWGRLAAVVTGRPRAALAVALLALLALAAPIASMHTANPGDRDLSADAPALVAQRTIDRAFPGSADTAELVVSGRGLGSAPARARLAALGREGQRITAATGTPSVRVATDGHTALVAIPIRTQNRGVAHRSVDALRAQLKPATAELIPGARAQIGGGAAEDVDFTSHLASVTPLVIAFVLALAFVLLVAAFRSPWLALSVMGLNLLSVGAAFGALVAVFQHHWAQSLLGFTSNGAIVNWLPLFAFVVLFGLSMDYTVLVLERAREARLSGADPREAAAEALGSTGGTVTSAAAVMVAVFAVFATLPLLSFKQLGVGLAVAIALDATIVRGVALPAVVTLLGDRGLEPARRRRRVRGRQWDHGSDDRALEPSYE